MKSRICIAGMIAGLILSAVVQNWLDAQPRVTFAADEKLYLTSGGVIKYAGLGFDGLLADIYWIRTIQYFGRKLEAQKAAGEVDWGRMPLLAPLLEITTELDRHHLAAYRFGAFFLQYTDPEKAV